MSNATEDGGTEGQRPLPQGKLSWLKFLYTLVIVSVYRITALGVVVHELAHQITVEWLGYEVYEVDYLSHVNHQVPRYFSHSIFIAYAPLVLNTTLATVVLYFGLGGLPTTPSALELSLQHAVALFVAFSLLLNALPSVEDVGNVIRLFKYRFKWYRIHILFSFAFVAPVVVPVYYFLRGTHRFNIRYVVDFGFTAFAFLLAFGVIPWWEALPVIAEWGLDVAVTLLEWFANYVGVELPSR